MVIREVLQLGNPLLREVAEMVEDPYVAGRDGGADGHAGDAGTLAGDDDLRAGDRRAADRSPEADRLHAD